MDAAGFSGAVPAIYDEALGPAIFEPYAVETARRAARAGGTAWLEVAAGTGRVTRHLATALPPGGRLVATDLNADMLAVAQPKVDDPRVAFEAADALALPFPEAGFDVAVCQFGAMFYPDRVAGHREARRVLRSGGTYLLAAWSTFEDNPWAGLLWELLAEAFAGDPPGFFRAPFAYSDPDEIARDLRTAGYERVDVEAVALPLVVGEARSFAGRSSEAPSPPRSRSAAATPRPRSASLPSGSPPATATARCGAR